MQKQDDDKRKAFCNGAQMFQKLSFVLVFCCFCYCQFFCNKPMKKKTKIKKTEKKNKQTKTDGFPVIFPITLNTKQYDYCCFIVQSDVLCFFFTVFGFWPSLDSNDGVHYGSNEPTETSGEATAGRQVLSHLGNSLIFMSSCQGATTDDC